MRIPRFVQFLRETGCQVTQGRDRLSAGLPHSGVLNPVDLRAGSEPHFSSDWAPMAAILLALRSNGTSRMFDDVFPDRLQFLDLLNERGLPYVRTEKTITDSGRACVRAWIEGRANTVLRAGRYPTPPDIRGSAATALSALAANGPAEVVDDFHIRRGYADLAGDLREIGLHVARREEPAEP